MVNLIGREVNQPPAIKHHSDSEIEVIQKYPLKLNHPRHNQHVERHVKLFTEASSQVCGIDCHDGLIWQKLKSRQIMKKFHSKHHFTVRLDLFYMMIDTDLTLFLFAVYRYYCVHLQYRHQHVDRLRVFIVCLLSAPTFH